MDDCIERTQARGRRMRYLAATAIIVLFLTSAVSATESNKKLSKPGTSPAGRAAIAWTDQFGRQRSYSTAVAVGKDESIVIGGWLWSKIIGVDFYENGAFRVYSPSREVVRTTRIGYQSDTVTDVAIGLDGKIFAAGNRGHQGEAFLHAFTPSGQTLWTKELGYIQEPRVAVADDGTVVLVGHEGVRAFSPSGDMLWTELAGDPPGSRHAQDVAAGGVNLFAVVGYIYINGRVPEKPYVRVYSSSGDVLWTDQYVNEHFPRRVAMDVQGNIVVTGFRRGGYRGGGDECPFGYARAYTPTGLLSWTDEFDDGLGLAVTIGGDGTTTVLTGWSDCEDEAMRFYSRSGTLLGKEELWWWCSSLTSLPCTQPHDLAAGIANNVFVVGNAYGAFLGNDTVDFKRDGNTFLLELLVPPGVPPACDSYAATKVGTRGPDFINGTMGLDVIVARGGDDIINGLDGDDLICAGPGNDIVLGGEGADIVFGERGDDTIEGGNDADRLDGGGGDDQIMGKRGDDYLIGDTGADRLNGGAGDDEIEDGRGNDVVYGGPGNDSIYSYKGDDAIYGDAGNDWLSVQYGENTVHGGSGDDTLVGGENVDHLFGGSGNDELYGHQGNDELDGGAGDDKLRGMDGHDVLRGSRGNDKLLGEKGNDALDGGRGKDRCRGGSGTDTIVNCEGDS